MAAFEKPLPPPSSWAGSELSGGHLEGAFVEGLPAVAWMSNNSAKLVGEQNSDLQCWTFLSSKSFGNANKVPQVPFTSSPRCPSFYLLTYHLTSNSLPGSNPEGQSKSSHSCHARCCGERLGISSRRSSLPCLHESAALVSLLDC